MRSVRNSKEVAGNKGAVLPVPERKKYYSIYGSLTLLSPMLFKASYYTLLHLTLRSLI